jgi:hypothetical protein
MISSCVHSSYAPSANAGQLLSNLSFLFRTFDGAIPMFPCLYVRAIKKKRKEKKEKKEKNKKEEKKDKNVTEFVLTNFLPNPITPAGARCPISDRFQTDFRPISCYRQ